MELLSQVLQGTEAGNEFCRALPKLVLFRYQCSPMSTAGGIEKTFKQARNHQKQYPESMVAVLLDEVVFGFAPLLISLSPSYSRRSLSFFFLGCLFFRSLLSRRRWDWLSKARISPSRCCTLSWSTPTSLSLASPTGPWMPPRSTGFGFLFCLSGPLPPPAPSCSLH